MKWFQVSVRPGPSEARVVGTLFTGHYKAVLVEREEPVYGRVFSDYICLNPARGRIVNAENLHLRTQMERFSDILREAKQPKWQRPDGIYPDRTVRSAFIADFLAGSDSKIPVRDVERCFSPVRSTIDFSTVDDAPIWIFGGAPGFQDRAKRDY